MRHAWVWSLPLGARGWKLSWYQAECRGDIDCCAPDQCRPMLMHKNPAGCINNAPASCSFPAYTWGQTWLEDKHTGLASEGCTGVGQGEVIFSLPSELHDPRYHWTRGNATVGPLDPLGMKPCYGTSWYMQFVNWPSAICDTDAHGDEEMLRVNDYVRINSEFQFNAPTTDTASNRNGAYLTVDLAAALGHPRTNALRILAGNQDCLLNPVALVNAINGLGEVRSVMLPGKSFQRRAITVSLFGEIRGQKGAVEPFTAPALAQSTTHT